MFALLLGQTALAAPTPTCAYDPSSGSPNPLGMRSYITVTETDGNTAFVFEQFPSTVGSGDPSPVTIASSRTLTMYGVRVEQARELLLQKPEYYAELVGYEDSEGFAPVNATLICR